MRRKYDLKYRQSVFVRQEAREKSHANAKVIAMCWRKAALKHTKIHIRRGYIVVANIYCEEDVERFVRFSAMVNKQNARVRNMAREIARKAVYEHQYMPKSEYERVRSLPIEEQKAYVENIFKQAGAVAEAVENALAAALYSQNKPK